MAAQAVLHNIVAIYLAGASRSATIVLRAGPGYRSRWRMDISGLCDWEPKLTILPKQIQIGSTVIVRLYDGRLVEAKVTAIVDSVIGRKVHVRFGMASIKVDEQQIVQVIQP